MLRNRRFCFLLSALFVMMMGSNVRADSPLPSCPTYAPLLGVGVYQNPTVCTPEAWDLIEAFILSLYPDADYGEICDYAVSMFNALPPVYGDDPPSCICCPGLCPGGLCPGGLCP
jgi:hypothetical protein